MHNLLVLTVFQNKRTEKILLKIKVQELRPLRKIVFN